MAEIIGRFAPTPSGYAHIGNMFCFLLAWLSAKNKTEKLYLEWRTLIPNEPHLN